MNVVTRSGTNKLHGSASEFVRNNYLDAVNFFATCKPVAPATTCTAKDTLHQYATAGTLGGKILRDKLFVFGGYQFFKAIQATATTTAHVPTAANLAGDFSVTDPAPGTTITSTSCATKTIQMFDPLTGAILPGNKYATPPTWNAQALKLQAYLPPTSDPCGLVGYAIPSQVYDKQFVTRVDYTINAKNDMYGRYFLDGYQAPAFFSPTNVLLTTNPGNIERVQTGAIGEVYTITPQTINTFHASVSRRVDVRGPAPGINACTIGITLSCPLPSGLQITVGSTATHGFSAYCGTCAPGHFNDNSLAIADDVTMMRGKHQILFGGEYVRNQLNIVGAFQADGNFTINGQYSANGPGGGAAIGDANLDFLLGAMSGFSQSKTQQNALRAPIPSLYVQDTYHASKQLTIVAGLRWSPEYFPWITSTADPYSA